MAHEAGITLERDWRGQGIGTELFRRGLAQARRRQMESFELLSYRGNIPIIRIAEKFGATESFAHRPPTEELAPNAPLPAWFGIDLHQVTEQPDSSARLGFLRRLLARLSG